MQEIIKLAKALHINLVPEIDTPGHALSFVKVRPDLMYKGQLSARKTQCRTCSYVGLG